MHQKYMFFKSTHHFFDLSLGGGFLGMRKRARIGCMSQSAGGKHKFQNHNKKSSP